MPAHDIEDISIDGHAGVALTSPKGDVRVCVLPALAMLIPSIEHAGTELLGQRAGVRAYADRGSTMGIPLLYPWANRIAGLEYAAAGRTTRLDPASPLLRLDGAGLPIHGLRTAGRGWRVCGRRSDAAGAAIESVLDAAADPGIMAAFPFPHQIRVGVELKGAELAIDVAIHAGADAPVPVALGFHPYLRLPGVPRPEWRVRLPVVRHASLDARGLPTGASDAVAPTDGALGRRTYDDLFTELAPPRAFTLAGGGRTLTLTMETGFPVAQVFAPADDAVIAFEPMTAPVNALAQGGPALPIVAPGGVFRTRFTLAVTGT